MRKIAIISLTLAAAAVLISQNRPAAKEDVLWQHRNLGKAFYENPTTQQQAVDEFRKALDLQPDSARERLNYALALLRAGKTAEAIADLKRVQQQDPKLPHSWFNLGIHYKKSGETEEALRQFEQMGQLVPADAVTQYNLGVLYKLVNRQNDAIARFLRAAELAPHLAAPNFQLYNAYRLGGKMDEARKRLAIFQELKKAQELSGITEDMEWNDYAEVYDPIDAKSPAADVKPAQFRPRSLPGAVGDRPDAIVFNLDGDAKPDLLVWSSTGGLLFKGGATPAPIDLARGRSFAAADVDNDGFSELCMITASGAELLFNRKGVLDKPKPLATGEFVKALWLDFDHDYDLDLMLLGPKPALLRNQGEGGLVDQTGAFPFVKGTPADGVMLRTIADTKSHDVVVTYRDRPSVLYSDRLAGRYDVIPLDAMPRGATRLQAADLDRDGQIDLAAITGGGLVRVMNPRSGWKAMAPHPVEAASSVFEDFNNQGDAVLMPNALAAADFNLDGKLDFVSATGGIKVHDNITASANRWFAVRLNGVKNRKLGVGAEVEVRSGRSYQKKLYQGFPLIFGLGGHARIDTVRITWPNGLIQNEPRQPVSRIVEYKEAQRLSGSCPMIFTWNGKRFEFLTDVLGVAPLGASSGDGDFFPVDHDEYVSIPSEALAERDGRYDLRITEELSEVTYLDQLKLIAVDHPASVEIFSNDKWKSPPFPEFRLFGTTRRITPVRAGDGRGHDARPSILHRDRIYHDRFERRMDNTAETHALELDFGPGAPNQGAFLVLHGWVDWADGSTFRKQSQEPGRALTPPYLQVRDAQGQWKTVIEDMGIPSGKTKTVTVDLSGRFLSASREVRIVTNLCVFWDEIFLGVEDSKPAYRLTELPAARADLAFHGFSKPQIHPERRQPEHFDYNDVSSIGPWNPTPGLYTRFGDVRPLLAAADDQYVIMGSGDEIQLRFANRSPSLPAGWKRDFLLYVDGWAKDSDANTAYSQTVEPLPFHRMSRYPYPAGEHYPADAAHRAYRDQYNTRPALNLQRALVIR